MIQPPLIQKKRLTAVTSQGQHAAGSPSSVSGVNRDITFDPTAVQAAVGTLYDTLRKCEIERVRLVTLMDDAKAVGRQNDQNESQTYEQSVPAAAETQPRSSLTAQQLTQIPAMDGWISRRLAELHEADRALAKRQQKLETLESSLTRITQGLATQLKQITEAKDELAGEQGSIEARLLAAQQQISEQLQTAEHRVHDHVQRMNEAQDDVHDGLVRFEAQGKQAMTQLQSEFETLAQGVVGRLEGVRKPVEKWLKQHLAQYETMLNDCVEKAHTPLADRIEALQSQVEQAMLPIEENLKDQMQAMALQVQANGRDIQDAMHQQTDAIHQSMVDRVKQLDEEVARLIEPVLEASTTREQAVRDQAIELQETFESNVASQRLAFERIIQEQVYAAQSQIRVAVQSSNTQMNQQIKQMKNDLAEHTTRWSADAEKQVQDALLKAEQNMNRGLEVLGHKSNEVEQWYAGRRSEMNQQMNELEEEARATAHNAQEIMARRVNETRKQLPATVEHLVQQAQQEVQSRVEGFQSQIEKAYQRALTESKDRASYLESQTLAQFNESDLRMRQRMATLHGDARSMLDMVEHQLARRVEACQSKVANVSSKPDADGNLAL